MAALRKVQIDEFIKQGLSRSEAEKKAIAPLFVDSGEEARRIYGVGQSETTVSRQPRHASPKFIVVKTKCW